MQMQCLILATAVALVLIETPARAAPAAAPDVSATAAAEITDVGAARRRPAERRPRRQAEPVASPPPSAQDFGYGIHDNSRYGGG